MRGYLIAIIISVAIFVVGILLSIFFNTFLLFLFLPIGIGWGFWRRGGRNQQQDTQRTQENAPPSSAFCTFCGARLQGGRLYCPNCGRPVRDNVSYSDLR